MHPAIEQVVFHLLQTITSLENLLPSCYNILEKARVLGAATFCHLLDKETIKGRGEVE